MKGLEELERKKKELKDEERKLLIKKIKQNEEVIKRKEAEKMKVEVLEAVKLLNEVKDLGMVMEVGAINKLVSGLYHYKDIEVLEYYIFDKDQIDDYISNKDLEEEERKMLLKNVKYGGGYNYHLNNNYNQFEYIADEDIKEYLTQFIILYSDDMTTKELNELIDDLKFIRKEEESETI